MTPEYFWIVAPALLVGAIGYAISRYVAHPLLGSVYGTIHPENEKLVALLTGMPQAPVETETSHEEVKSDIAASPQSNADSGCNQTDLKHADDSLADDEAPIDLLKGDVDGLSSSPVEDGNNPPTVTSIGETAITVATMAPSNLEGDAKTDVAARSPSKSPAKKATSKSKAAKRLSKNKPAERLSKSEPARV